MFDSVKMSLSFGAPTGIDEHKWLYKPSTRNRNKKNETYVEKLILKTRSIDQRIVCYIAIQTLPIPKLIVSASLPRLAYGENVTRLEPIGFDGVVGLLDALVSWGLTDYRGYVLTAWETHLREQLPVPAPNIPSVADWPLSRLDLPFDYRPRGIAFNDAHRELLALQPTGRLVRTIFAGQTAYFRSPAKRRRLEIVVYSKHDEAIANKRAVELAKGLIRVEVRLRGSDTIRRAFSLKRTPTLREVFDPVAVGSVLFDKLALLDVRPGLASILTDRETLLRHVGRRKTRRLWPFVELRATSRTPREVERELGVSHETGLRWLSELREAALYPVAVNVTGVVEQLVEQIEQWIVHAARPRGLPTPVRSRKHRHREAASARADPQGDECSPRRASAPDPRAGARQLRRRGLTCTRTAPVGTACPHVAGPCRHATSGTGVASDARRVACGIGAAAP